MSKILKCYITTSSSIDIKPILRILDNLKVEYLDLYNISIGSSFSDLIKRKLRESDFVIAIINDNNKNVFYEIGVAEGLNKPLFLIIDKDTKIPFYLKNKFFYQIDWNKDTMLLELSLKNYIEDITNKSVRYRKKNIVKDIRNLTLDDTNEILSQLKELRKSNHEEQMVSLITYFLKRLNIQAVSELPSENSPRVDIAIFNENLLNFFGNPLLIEIETGDLTFERIEQAELRLQDYINKTDASSGILLYFDKKNKRFENMNKCNPFILRFDIEDFIRGITTEGFEKFLIKTRNELVHGKIK